MKSTLKIAIQKALTKNLPLILEDAVQSLENHHLQLKRRTKTHPQRTKQIKKIQIKESATIPYFDESDEIEAQYDCPPESWEDIGFEEEAAPPEADIVSEPDDESRFEAAASNPYFDDIYDQLD